MSFQRFYLVLLLSGLLITCSCTVFSGKSFAERTIDHSISFNGGFEIVKDGLPVNWLFFTEKTINHSYLKKKGDVDTDFDMLVDTMDYAEGKQSLKFVVRQCTGKSDWHSPGFCDEFPAEPDQLYEVGFWVKNEGSEFQVTVDAVNAKKGAPHQVVVIKSKDTIRQWKHYVIDRSIPHEMSAIRIVVNILSPGTFQIDGFTIYKEN